MNLGVISYTTAAVFFVVFAGLLLTRWHGRMQGAILVLAITLSTFWAASAAYVSGVEAATYTIAYYILEVLRNAAWFIFLFRLLAPLKKEKATTTATYRYAEPTVLIFTVVILVADLSPVLVAKFLPVTTGVDIRVVGHLAFAIIGLALIEQLFRNTVRSERWAVKYLYLGIGTIFVYDFFMYADALLFRRLDADLWQARGFINALIVPLLAISVSRNPEWSLKVFVSQRAFFHTAALIGAGLYLLFMAGTGYYIREYGGTWGGAAQATFLSCAILLLIVILYSGQMRARVRIFISKHFFGYKYDYRDEWLALSNTLTSSELELRERAIRALANIVDSPGGILWTRTEAGHFSYTTHWSMGRPVQENIPEDSSLVRFLEERQWIIDLKDYEQSYEEYDGLEIPQWLRDIEHAWLVIPLIQNDVLIAFILIADSRAPRLINWEDRDLLKTVGLQVANYIDLIGTTEALTNARQFEAFNRLSSYVVHDLKNVSAQLSLVVSNAKRHKDNPEFIEDAFKTIENATIKMNRMLAQLRKGGKEESTKAIVNLTHALREAVSYCRTRSPKPVLVDPEEEILVFVDQDKLVNVVTHLIQNAQEATAADGYVKLQIKNIGEEAELVISDNGSGMSEKFMREELFRPFATTKGNAGMGIGVYESREFIWAQGGDLRVNSREGEGTTFVIRLPLYKDAPGHVEVLNKKAEEV
jgi:putative PEP-CTERM system histidine kinase